MGDNKETAIQGSLFVIDQPAVAVYLAVKGMKYW
jgi:hypothetical protein